MKQEKTWAIVYHHTEPGFEADCLKSLFTGTEEKAKEIAKKYTKETGINHWVEDGTATAEAFAKD